ncbi:MAG: acyl carrier protein [Gemmatimonadales bacterium]|nr:acyl carrier protein [Gemmatimonadales bacterium]MDG2241308.1 phosphopantetheine-binding protein [Longimicrobiales bacterium]NCG33173.1 acyl carrier protein [Pseudomonadota bacterium]MBT3500516.1 acyl carrier protein [Gemmatimonadales bacterium]MBT3775027.1 acyl carrier protein [Gemmatimonadales bacterium]
MRSEAQIIELLVEKYGVERDQVSPDAVMLDMGLDSLSVAELVFDIEDLFDIVLMEEDVDFSTFGDAVALVDRHLESKDP